jgi:NlpC/P60 family putative phage cell wall peptidase
MPHTPPNIVAAARNWLGTPYHHQASTRGVGCDCLGLVRGLYRDVTGIEPEPPPAYTRDWTEATGEETLITAATRHLTPIALTALEPGAVVIFRWRAGYAAKHCAILSSSTRMIHAHESTGVVEVAFTPWWRRRLAAAFVFPSELVKS